MFKNNTIVQELFKSISLLSKKVSEKFEEVKELSEAEVKISDRSVGAKVELINGDGELSAAPDGNYKVGDFSFSVKDGVITSIEGEEAPKEEEVKAEDVPAPEETPREDELAPLKEAIAQLQEANKSIIASIEEIKAALNQSANQDDFNSMKTAIESLNETVLAFSKMPAEFSQTNKSAEVKNDKEDKLIGFASVLNKINSKN